MGIGLVLLIPKSSVEGAGGGDALDSLSPLFLSSCCVCACVLGILYTTSLGSDLEEGITND